jgi:hypothetical protein
MKKTRLAATIHAILADKNSLFYQAYFASLSLDEGKKRREAFFKLRAAGASTTAAISGFVQAAKAVKLAADKIAAAANTDHQTRREK